MCVHLCTCVHARASLVQDVEEEQRHGGIFNAFQASLKVTEQLLFISTEPGPEGNRFYCTFSGPLL